MTVQQRINADLKDAIKTGNTEKKNLLRVVIGEFNRIGKELDDEIAVKEIKKMYVNACDAKIGNPKEAEILSEYLPKELSESELQEVISRICKSKGYDNMKSMGAVMGQLKSEHPNEYDGKLASSLVKKQLAS